MGDGPEMRQRADDKIKPKDSNTTPLFSDAGPTMYVLTHTDQEVPCPHLGSPSPSTGRHPLPSYGHHPKP